MKKVNDIYNDVETFDVLKNSQLLIRFKGDEVNGKRKVYMEELIGEKLGPGKYAYAIKYDGQTKKQMGQIRGVAEIKNPKQNFESGNMDNVMLKQLADKFDKMVASKENNSSSLLEFQRQLSQSTIDWYKDQNKALESKCEKLEAKLEQLEDKLESVKANEGGTSGLDQILAMVPMFLKMKGGSAVSPGLKDEVLSDASDIPQSFLQALGTVDWSQISDDQKQTILGYWNQFQSNLPLKG